MDMEIKPAYQHSKLGQLCFNISASCAKFFIKHRTLYYIVTIIWNFIMTFLGCLVTLVLAVGKIFNKNIKFETYHWIYCIKVGPNYWGGFDTGLMFIRDQKSSDNYLNTHEWGHSISQGVWLGPLFPFVVAIPSAIRWWARTLFPKKQWPAYDSFWAEDAATQCGKYVHNYLIEQQNKNV